MVGTYQGSVFHPKGPTKCSRLRNSVNAKKGDGTQHSNKSSENNHQGEKHKLSSKRDIISFLFSTYSDISLDFYLFKRVPSILKKKKKQGSCVPL